MPSPKVVAVVLAHNEVRALPRTLNILRAFRSKGIINEIIVVNDGSTDDTAYVAQRGGAKVITQENKGKRGGFITGAFAAKESKADAMVLFDADIIRMPEKTLRDMINAVTTGRCLMSIAQQYERYAPKSNIYHRVHATAANAQRAFNLKGLEPLFNKNKKWMEYLTGEEQDIRITKLTMAKWTLESSGNQLSEETRKNLQKQLTIPEAAKWGLEAALDILIPRSKIVWFHEPSHLSQRKRPHESRIYTREAFGRVGSDHKKTNINEAIGGILAEEQEGGDNIINNITYDRVRRARELKRRRLIGRKMNAMKKIFHFGKSFFR